MRLIIIAGLVRSLRQIYRPCWIKIVKNLLITIDARHFFWRSTRKFLELGDQVFLAHAHVLTEVDLQGGSIRLDSLVGRGTTVTVTLPDVAPGGGFTTKKLFRDNVLCNGLTI